MPAGNNSSGIDYSPVVSDADALVAQRRPRRCLWVADEVDDDAALLAAGNAFIRPPVTNSPLPVGYYTFWPPDRVGSPDMMVVVAGGEPGRPDNCDWHDGASALVHAHGWFETWLDEDLTLKVPDPRYDHRAEVRRRGTSEAGLITRRFVSDGSWWYGFRPHNGSLQDVAEDRLEPIEYSDDPKDWIASPPCSADEIAATLTRAKLELEFTNTYFSFGATRTLFRPYQFKPLMRLLESDRGNLLIADEVGLGKTIEAGLIWTELDARREADRVLIVCPSSLVQKWRNEMWERFGYNVDVLDRGRLDELLERAERADLPRRRPAIVSIERLRTWGGLEELAALRPSFDLIICDEAHAFRNRTTRSFVLAQLLSDWADRLLFLSATPLNLGNSDLYNLLELLAPGEFGDQTALEDLLATNVPLNRISKSLFDPAATNQHRREWLASLKEQPFGPQLLARPDARRLDALLSKTELTPDDKVAVRRAVSGLHALSAVVTRTRKQEVQEDKVVREPRVIEAPLSPPERRFHDAFNEWQFERARTSTGPVGFVTQMPRRLVSSSVHAAARRMLSNEGWTFNADDLMEPSPDEVEMRRDVPDADAPVVLVNAARSVLSGPDTKLDALVDQLRPLVDSGRRAIIFTHSRPVLAYLAEQLSAAFAIDQLHGGVRQKDRPEVMRRFRSGEFSLLLASRVASEGLDFEFCSAVVNWDLPWNPMEVEQRIGRIDRFGQAESKIAIFNFHTPGTIDTDVMARVMERIGVFEESIGELEPIIGANLRELEEATFSYELTDEQRREQVDRTLSAISERKKLVNELEDAAPALSTTDHANIEGLEREIRNGGRYVGPLELVVLLQQWCRGFARASCEVLGDRPVVEFRCVAEMNRDLGPLYTKEIRSSAELAVVDRWIRDEQSVHLALDTEFARTSGLDMLEARHPLVLAALQSRQKQERFAGLTLSGDAPGRYLAMVTILEWTGEAPVTEAHITAVDLATLELADPSIGSALFAGLAEGRLADTAVRESGADLTQALKVAQRGLRTFATERESELVAHNNALVDTRMESKRRTHATKTRGIEQAITTLRGKGDDERVIRMNEGRLNRQSAILEEELERLESKRNGVLNQHNQAVLVLEVVA